MRLLHTVMICGAALSVVAACVQRAPFQTVSESCGHLTAYPDLYASCAESVRVGNQIREDAWQDATARNQQQSVPTFTPDPAIYTLHTQPPPPPSPMPIPNLGSVYMPPPSPLPNSPAMPGPYLGHVPGGPDVYGVPAGAISPPPAPQLQ